MLDMDAHRHTCHRMWYRAPCDKHCFALHEKQEECLSPAWQKPKLAIF